MPLHRIILVILLLSISSNYLLAQTDTSKVTNTLHITKASLNGAAVKDSSVAPPKKKHIPRVATLRSAIIPGWGQIYNGDYWKVPIVYTAISIPVYTFFYNKFYYKRINYAYTALYNLTYIDTLGSPGYHGAVIAYNNIDHILNNLDLYSLETYRDEFRKDMDYSILWFAILWGVNVADATVFAHMKDFDVSRDLSFHLSPKFDAIDGKPTLSLVFNAKKPTHKLCSLITNPDF
jgi:hypothetical protein